MEFVERVEDNAFVKLLCWVWSRKTTMNHCGDCNELQ